MRARTIIIANGPGTIDHSDKDLSTHKFHNATDGDLWSAFNDIWFKVGLTGEISETSDGTGLCFKGTLKLDVEDFWGFSDPALGHRKPFGSWTFLPDRYQNMPEYRFLDLEGRGWTKPFNVEGNRTATYSITVSKTDPDKSETRYSPYDS